MKRNFLKNSRRNVALTVIGLGLGLGLTQCGNNVSLDDLQNLGNLAEGLMQPKDQWRSLVNESKLTAQASGNSLTYGDHVYTVNGEIDYNSTEHKTPTANVTFTHVPSGYTEFEVVYNGLLGKSIQGTAAMIPMALEIYARDASTGERCLRLLCNSASTVDGIIRILKTKLVPSEYSPENDQYIQRYMPAALQKGAPNTNAYRPD